jgi:hypothetical protein
MTAEITYTELDAGIDLDRSRGGMGSDLILALNDEGIIADVLCQHLEVLFADVDSLVGEHIAKFIPENLASLLASVMRRSSKSGRIAQSNFSYTAHVDGIPQDFSCELVYLGAQRDKAYKWLALIKRISGENYDNWLIQSKNRLLFAVTQASEALMSERGFAEVMNESLYYIGNGVGVDRVYFFAAEDDESSEKICLSQKFEWCSEYTSPQIDNPELQHADMSLYADMWAQLINNRPFKAVVSKMPENFTREILAEQEIKSILMIPIFVAGELWGMLGFDDCQYERNWQGVDIAVLKMLATIIAARAQRESIAFS